ncbi:MAG: anti-sigma factor domain-containing protein [Solirubrobacterales bacterium]
MTDETRQRAVTYLLGELGESEAAAFERDLLANPELTALVEQLRPVVGKLEGLPDEAWEPAEPPPLVMPGTAPEAVRTPAASSPRRGFRWLRAGAGLAASAAILAVGVLIGFQLDDSGPSEPAPQRTLALDSFGEAPAGASGKIDLVSSEGDAATVDVSGLRPTGDSEFYELWLLGEEGELVALGSFRVEPDGHSRIEVPLPVDPDDYQYFDVSVQPDNGDPGHSGVSVLRGLTSA